MLESFHPAVRTWFERRFPAGPTAPQAGGWHEIAAGNHILIAAPTGSGKTFAAFLAAIDALVRQGVRGELRLRPYNQDSELLLELGCEELPASWLPDLTNQIGEVVVQQLTERRLPPEAPADRRGDSPDRPWYRAVPARACPESRHFRRAL